MPQESNKGEEEQQLVENAEKQPEDEEGDEEKEGKVKVKKYLNKCAMSICYSYSVIEIQI